MRGFSLVIFIRLVVLSPVSGQAGVCWKFRIKVGAIGIRIPGISQQS
jgi:hypothetical protein